jgi:hypothetical protein
MTKREFIKRLHLASPKFKDDLTVLERLMADLESGRSAEQDTIRQAISSRLEQLQKNWPRARDFINWPTFSDWADWDSTSEAVTDLKALFADVTPFGRAKLEGIEIDPGVTIQKGAKEIIKSLVGEQSEEFPSEKLFGDENDAGGESIRNLRRSEGEKLFSKAKIVIPIYPETHEGDINWRTVQELKQLVYGSSYRPPEDTYEIVIKIFERGQLLEEVGTYKSWQEIADSVGLGLSTVRNIYDRAHQLVYGRPAAKRRYQSEAEITVPKSPDEIPENPGPSLRGKLTNINEIDRFRNVLAEMEEDEQQRCFNCQDTMSRSLGEDVLPQHYAELRKYGRLPAYPGDGAFLCTECLLKIVSSSKA